MSRHVADRSATTEWLVDRANAGPNANGELATPESRDAGFRAVSGGPELANGSVLLVEAYAAIWILALAFVAMTWRRMVRLEGRLSTLDRALAARPPSGTSETASAASDARGASRSRGAAE